MRTLQEKYNAIQEGKFSKEHFLAEARMQQPQLVTRFNGYNDAVQILKNRGMIRETYSTEESFKDYSNDALTDMVINLSKFEGNEDTVAMVKAELARRKQNISEISSDTFKSAVDVARNRGENQRASKLGSTFLNAFVGKPLMGGKIFKIDIQKPSFGDYFHATLKVLVPTQGTQGMYDKPEYLYYDVENDDWNMKGKGLEITRSDARVLSQIATKINPDTKYSRGVEHFDIKGSNEGALKEARLTNKSLTDYRYKPTNDMDKYPYEQILRGLRVELEGLQVLGTPTPEEYKKALAKVLKNLEKDEIFYTNQLAGNNKKVDLHDKMVDATPKNTVDTFNGMKKATLKEGIKNLIKKALMENEEDVYEMQGPKEDSYYKNELSNYLDDNGIFGYTKRIHDIMTGPDEAENIDELVRFLEDNQIYGYNRGIERIYSDYPYDQHYMNQPDEDEEDDMSHPRGYEEASDEESFEDLFESVSLKDLL